MAISKVPVVAGTKTLTRGSIVAGNASGEPAALAIGSNGQVLKSDGTDAVWGTDAGGAALTGSTNNTVVTVTGANAIQGEANLTYDGSTLSVKPGSNVNQLKLEQNNATDYWSLHADSSGGPLSFNRYTGGAETERMNISSTGELAVTSSDSASGTQTLKVATTGNANPAYANLVFKSGGNTSGVWIKGVQASGGNDGRLEFYTNNSGTVGERLRIMYDGKILANTASPIDNNAAFSIKELANYPLATKVDATGNTQQIGFNNGNGHVGGITTNGTSTAFNTSSDYRLKENIDYDFDATARLKQLKPARFNFKTDASKTVDGFLAHEVSSIIPEAITGIKDATETRQNIVLNANDTMIYNGVLEQDYIDGKANGSYPSDSTWIAEKEVPVYQSIDESKLVPLLVKSLQETLAEIDTLKTKVTALENA